MYFKEDKEKGKKFIFFSREREVGGNKVTHTERTVFGTLSEGIKTGENNGQPIWENDYWNASFCGKAYEKALELKDKERIVVTEMNIRNIYHRPTKRSYPQIMVTEFFVPEAQAHQKATGITTEEAEGFMNIPDGIDEGLPFN